MSTCFDFGVPAERGAFGPRGLRLLLACENHRAFAVVELQSLGAADVVVVDCVNDQVGRYNPAGIHPRERLALLVPRDEAVAPEARTLRSDFPALGHMNQVPAYEPQSLCLWAEAWSTTRRSWTPQKFLERILWWLTGAASNTLHGADQGLEPFYFDAPHQLVLPVDYQARAGQDGGALVCAALLEEPGHQTAILQYGGTTPQKPEFLLLQPVLEPVVHGRIERWPATLGELDAQLTARGAPLFDALRQATRVAIGDQPRKSSLQFCALVLNLGLRRVAGGPVERTAPRGFRIGVNELTELAIAIGLCAKTDGFSAMLLIPQETTAWKALVLHPISIRTEFNREKARAFSGVSPPTADLPRVLAGVGALGSALMEIWSREGWGGWTILDPDRVEPHNLARHVAVRTDVGLPKAAVVRQRVASIFPPGAELPTALPVGVLSDNAAVTTALRTASLVVDVTTTLEVPRELSRREQVGRCSSVFLAPSGLASVLLLEDALRTHRLDSLEAQYYSAVIVEGWGEDHLSGRRNGESLGGGCRDISVVLSGELIQLHAGILSGQLRRLSETAEAQIRIWIVDSDSRVAVQKVEVHRPIPYESNGWTVLSNTGISRRMGQIRHEHLPKETGGIVLGYVDHAVRTIYVVGVLPAPADSKGEATGFVRGVEGLEATVAESSRRTAGIVGYLGEWHSHPPFNSPSPSGDDRALLAHLAAALRDDGEPALMMIIGTAGEISCTVRQEG